MANFTRDWNESTVADTAQANTLGAVDRANQVDLSDRLKDLIYGFIAGENDGNPGVKNLIFKQQASAPSTPNADEISLYALDDGSNCGLFAKNEDGYTKQIIKKIGSDILLDITDEVDDSTVEVSSGKIQLKDAGITFAKLAAAPVVTEGEGISSNDNDITLPTSAAVKDYADTQDAANVPVGAAPTLNDSESNAMLKGQDYKAQTAGFVSVVFAYPNAFSLSIGSSDPPTIKVGEAWAGQSASNRGFVCFVPKDYYFRVAITSGTGDPTIYWIPLISGGAAPIDQD